MTSRQSQFFFVSCRLAIACVVFSFAPDSLFAATVYTPIYNANITVIAPSISSSKYISPITETVFARMPRDWGALTGVTVEYLSVTGNHEASGIADGAGAGQSVIFGTRAFIRVNRPGRTYASEDDNTAIAGGFVAVGGPPTVYQENFVLTDFNNTLDIVTSTWWEEAFYDDSAIQPIFSNIVHFSLSGNIGVTADGSSTVLFSQRIRYDFVETAAYANAGSPTTLGAVPEPGACTLALVSLCLAMGRRRIAAR